MNPDDFMNRLSGRMNSRRAILVDEAFDRLDTAGKGYLALEEVRNVLPCPCMDRLLVIDRPSLMEGGQ